jgi:hypothetical protein
MCARRLERLHLKGASTLFTQRVAAWMHGGMKNFLGLLAFPAAAMLNLEESRAFDPMHASR